MRICSVRGCVNKHEAQGYCDKHYHRLRRYGNPKTKLCKSYPRTEDLGEYLSYRVEFHDEGCWPWIGNSFAGYGRGVFLGESKPAHRWAYQHWVGPIDEHAEIHHRCANRLCVNPDHLQMVSGAENRAEMRERKAFKHEIASLKKEVRFLKREAKKT